MYLGRIKLQFAFVVIDRLHGTVYREYEIILDIVERK